jgi:glycosyltransferase involved in cell wall biosynthesis
MKVGLYIAGGTSPIWGGGHTFVIELLSALDRMRGRCNHELMLCYYQSGEELARQFSSFSGLNLDAARAEVLSKREKFVERLPNFVQRIRRFVQRTYHGALVPSSVEDRVYLREGIEFIVQLNPFAALRTNVPFATTVWDLEHRKSPWFPESGRLQEWNDRENIYGTPLRRAAMIYTGTHQGRLEIASFYQLPADRIKVFPFGTPEFALALSNKPQNPELLHKYKLSTEYIFYPAIFFPHKNHVLVLEACKIIGEMTPWTPEVVFVGADQGNLGYVQEYARKLGLADRVRFLGFVDQHDLVQLYKGAFCLAYPSFFGPDNLPPLEALAIGCPVVAADVPGAREHLGEAAIFFPPTQETKLAEAILSLRNRETRERLVLAGHTRARLHTWDHYALHLIESLDDFAAIRRAWA